VQMVTINLCGTLVRLVWINGALARLTELQEAIKKQQQSRNPSRALEVPACTASEKE